MREDDTSTGTPTPKGMLPSSTADLTPDQKKDLQGSNVVLKLRTYGEIRSDKAGGNGAGNENEEAGDGVNKDSCTQSDLTPDQKKDSTGSGNFEAVEELGKYAQHGDILSSGKSVGNRAGTVIGLGTHNGSTQYQSNADENEPGIGNGAGDSVQNAKRPNSMEKNCVTDSGDITLKAIASTDNNHTGLEMTVSDAMEIDDEEDDGMDLHSMDCQDDDDDDDSESNEGFVHVVIDTIRDPVTKTGDRAENAISVLTAPLSETPSDNNEVYRDAFDSSSDEEEAEAEAEAFSPKILSDSVVSLSGQPVEMCFMQREMNEPRRKGRNNSDAKDPIIIDDDEDEDTDDAWADISVNELVQKSTPISSTEMNIPAVMKQEQDPKLPFLIDSVRSPAELSSSSTSTSPAKIIQIMPTSQNNQQLNLQPRGQQQPKYRPLIQGKPLMMYPQGTLNPRFAYPPVTSFSSADSRHLVISTNAQGKKVVRPTPVFFQPRPLIIAPSSTTTVSTTPNSAGIIHTIQRNPGALSNIRTPTVMYTTTRAGVYVTQPSQMVFKIANSNGNIIQNFSSASSSALTSTSSLSGPITTVTPQLQRMVRYADSRAGVRIITPQPAKSVLDPSSDVSGSLLKKTSTLLAPTTTSGGITTEHQQHRDSPPHTPQGHKTLFADLDAPNNSQQIAINRPPNNNNNSQQQLATLSRPNQIPTDSITATTAFVEVSKVLAAKRAKASMIRGGLETYIAPKPPLDLNFSPKWKQGHTYTCRECGDSFLFKSSLHNHYERKAMLVRYFCSASTCNKELAFSNKCACTKHRLTHIGEGTTASSGPENAAPAAIVTVLPPQMMPTVPAEVLERHKLKMIEKAELRKKIQEEEMNREEQKMIDEEVNVDDVDEEFEIIKKELLKFLTDLESENGGAAAPAPEPASEHVVQSRRREPAAGSMQSRAELEHFLTVRPDIVRLELCLDNRACCTECDRKIGANSSGRSRHFKRRSPNWPSSYKCQRCMMILPNSCAYAAHMRIHDMLTPYVCPVCGEKLTGDRKHFMRHVRFKCLHFYQKWRTSCCFCNVESDSTKPPAASNEEKYMLGQELENHVFKSHVDQYHKCVLCPLAFRSSNSLTKHHAEMHAGNALVTRQIFRCPGCKQIIHSLNDMRKHVDEHLMDSLDDSKVIVMLFCSDCDFYGNYKAFRNHLQKMHSVTCLVEICGECGKTFKLLRDHLIHRVMEHTDLPQHAIKELTPIQPCQSEPKEEHPPQPKAPKQAEAEKVVVKIETQDEDVDVCKEKPPRERLDSESSREVLRQRCHSEATSEASSNTSDRTQPPFKRMRFPVVGQDKSVDVDEFNGQVPTAPAPEARYPCSECEKKFIEKSHAQIHMQEAHDIAPSFPCHLCSNAYATKQQLKAHIKTAHEGRSHSHPFMCFICEARNQKHGFKKRTLLEKHLLSSHKIDKKDYSRLLPSPEATSESIPDAPMRKLREGDDHAAGHFQCAKCQFSCKERETFQEHIVKHRNKDSTSPQCQECGLSFSIILALQRHLFIVHKIKHFDTYKETIGMKVEPIGSPLKSSDMEHTPTNPTSLRLRHKLSPEEKEARKKRCSQQRMDEDTTLESLTCQVCYRDFLDETSLKLHSRTHGLVFIRSKRSTHD